MYDIFTSTVLFYSTYQKNYTLILGYLLRIIQKRSEASMKKTEQSIQRCVTISTVQKILGGKWKIEILYYIGMQDIHRFGELRRHVGDITESSLTKQLRELETDGFINRYDFKEVPPHVEYTLTPLGESFMSVLEVIKQWGDLNLK
ncbi:HTH-type transcriptional activator hxlR [uncultured Blautia sp.]|nr:HTH-type transcriptional activator hxlR [uncultured Blautia sp.]